MSVADLSPAAARVARALAARGVDCTVRELPASTRTAAEAAAAIGCRVEQIAKSIVFRGAVSGEPILVVASGGSRVDERRLAAAAGEGIERADPDFVKRELGFAIGGVPPLGHARPVRTFVDPGLLELDTVWAAAGTPHAVFSIAPGDLLRATGGELLEE
ncbi:MAG TPA: YbaK/EbsC family protein [Thermoanaerobaculia bacterium]|nr:YbaK/EbsC family protein [Thermoanaerobaculia bacterium]